MGLKFAMIWEGYDVYRFAICDDDVDFAASLKEFVTNFFKAEKTEFSVTVFQDVHSLDAALDKGEEYDLLFLDILFENGNGMDYAKHLRAQKHKFDIVFISACRDYAIESYDAEPLYYILKPVSYDKVRAALNRFLEKRVSTYINLKTTLGPVKINLSDILYFEIYGHRVCVRKKDGTSEELRGTLKDIEMKLPGNTFVRPHRSYLVNLGYITEITHYNLKITTGEVIPISHALYSKIHLEFLDYLDKTTSIV